MSRARAVTTSGHAGRTGRLRSVASNMWAAIARPPAASAMRSVLSAGITVCGASSRIPVNATSALNAIRPWRAGSTVAGAATIAYCSGRHQTVPASQRLTGGLPGNRPLLPAHADRPVEQRDVLEAVVAEPAEDF